MLEHMKPTWLLVILLGSVLLLSCEKYGPFLADKPKESENILRFDVNAPLASLGSPAGLSGSSSFFPLLFSYLFVPDPQGKLEPDLAVAWTYDAEDFAWTIRLREDARFHNGEPVSAGAVKHTLETNLREMRPSLFSLIDQMELLSDHAIRITLKKDDPGFPRKIWDMEILPPSVETLSAPQAFLVGSGPFKFKHRKGRHEVFLEANDRYFGGRPSLDGVVFHFQPDKEKAWTRLLAGETDIALEISPKNFEIMEQYEDRFYFDLYTLKYYAIVLYNITAPLFSDSKVRRALTFAIDREYIVREILNDYGVVAVSPMGVESPYHNPEARPMPFDPHKALELLKEAGWVSGPGHPYLEKAGKLFEFTLFVFKESQVEKRVAQYVQICLNDLGIKMHLKPLSYEELIGRYIRNNQFDALLTEFRGVYRDPEFLKQLWCIELYGTAAEGSFERLEICRLIQKALDEKDRQKQTELFHSVEDLFTALQPGTFLFHKTAIDVMSKRFGLPHPFSLSHEGIHRLRHAWLKRE